MSAALQACHPHSNATVSASAGSGKTWLLVSRIVRLLLAGAEPHSILAITFTRKAATEMAERLLDRLYLFATADDAQLSLLLAELGLHTEEQDLAYARSLYERLLADARGVQLTTFHAFSQQLLRRFPLEANIAANFELVETTELLREEAWDALMEEATRQPEAETARAVESLMAQCKSVYNVRTALFSFLEHRSDWWAMSDALTSPVDEICTVLAGQLDIDPDNTPVADDFIAVQRDALQAFAELLQQHKTKNNLEHAAQLQSALASGAGFATVASVFLTQKGEPRKRKSSAAQVKSLGAEGDEQFLALHESISAQLLAFQDLIARHNTYALNRDWFRSGVALLDHYQRIKNNRRILDFADLEWKAYHLLNMADNAQWVQYKLDHRINHLLVDEFQDTNPTQWRMLKPLLEELASSQHDRQRSCFIVGDSKQSIYGFRRADASLFGEASRWLADNLDAQTVPLETSWRSSPAVIDFVNAVFSSGELHEHIQQFATHSTHKTQLWGKVEILPIFTEPGDDTPPATGTLRNPLLQPREQVIKLRYQHEAQYIADTISELVASGMQIDDGGQPRAIRYSDIMILLRTRTEAASYEAALREKAIPYFGADKSSLLDRVEVVDLMALLDVLVTPHNNLALARVLRSPLFSFDNDTLVQLAEHARRHACEWMSALHMLAQEALVGGPLREASRLLSEWQALCGTVPVHDLLDRIYSQANVYERFSAAAPAYLHNSIHSNLTRFIELALEIDSGRYPSMSQFRMHLRAMGEFAPDKMNQAPGSGDLNRIHMMTIHASKGLEAPVVFLADSARSAEERNTYSALVSWPGQADRPELMVLLPPQKQRDSKLQLLQGRQAGRDIHEQANLLYVAVTRAKQMLFISACQPQRGNRLGWYGQLCTQIDSLYNTDCMHEGYCYSVGEPQYLKAETAAQHEDKVRVDINRLVPAEQAGRLTEIAPSYTGGRLLEAAETSNRALIDEADSSHGRQRGILVHSMLEKLSTLTGTDKDKLYRHFCNRYADTIDSALLDTCWAEANRAITDCPEPQWFDQQYTAYTEVPLVYREPLSGRTVNGVIDRLVVDNDMITIIDYKTHRSVTQDNLADVARRYTEQMRYYADGIMSLWPGKQVKAWLYFTHSLQKIECQL